MLQTNSPRGKYKIKGEGIRKQLGHRFVIRAKVDNYHDQHAEQLFQCNLYTAVYLYVLSVRNS